MDFNHYFTNDELETALKTWTETYPQITNLAEIGRSHENRPIWLLTLTNTATGPAESKPALWLDANIHATELAGTTTLLYFTQHVLEAYGLDPRITQLLDTSTVYAVPRINPDGAAAAMGASPHFLRSGVRPYPWEEHEDGLHIQDIDGDGHILQMRIPDSNGDWKAWEQDPRFMIKREATDFGGTYYRLLPEGVVENYDGYVIDIARPSASLDFNRNFPFEWRPESDQLGAGPFPASEPEINAVVRFVATHSNVNIALTFHTFGRVLLRPYSTKTDEQMEPLDLYVFKILGDIGTKITGYRNVSTYHDFISGPRDITTGAFDDWVYDHFGAFVFTIELWDMPTEAGVQDRKFSEWWQRHPLEDDLMIYQWARENAGPDCYIDWHTFEHPQLGTIELGGWNTLHTWRNPPHAFMQAEAAKHLPYILALGGLLPHLRLHTLKTTQVGECAWTIDLVVENRGYLPTYTSQQACKRKAARPVMAEMRVPEGARIVLGKERLEIGHLEGRSNKDDMSSVFGRSPTDNRKHIQWMIEAPAGAQVELIVRSDRAGTLRQTIQLG